MCSPEPRTDPPEADYITVDCGHEIYEGEEVFEWTAPSEKHPGGVIEETCADCFESRLAERWDKLTLEQKADLIGEFHHTVRFD